MFEITINQMRKQNLPKIYFRTYIIIYIVINCFNNIAIVPLFYLFIFFFSNLIAIYRSKVIKLK